MSASPLASNSLFPKGQVLVVGAWTGKCLMVFLEDKCKSPAFEVRESRKHQNIVVFPPLKQYDPENEKEFRTAYILHSIHVSFHDSEMPLSQIFTEQGIFFLLWGVRRVMSHHLWSWSGSKSLARRLCPMQEAELHSANVYLASTMLQKLCRILEHVCPALREPTLKQGHINRDFWYDRKYKDKDKHRVGKSPEGDHLGQTMTLKAS